MQGSVVVGDIKIEDTGKTMLKPMTRTQLVAAMAEESGLTKRNAAAALTALSAVVIRELDQGGGVSIPDVLKITSRARPAREVRNPATGEMVTRDADRAVKVLVNRDLKKRIAG
jgi:DNA-binding protein HU-beta